MSISTLQTPSGRTPEQDAVICALIGLARAAEAKEIPAGTGPVLFASLAAAMPENTLSASAANDLISQIHEQKAIIAPDCAACPSPCGRTADFLPEDLNRTDDGLFEERNRLLKKLSEQARTEWTRILADQEDPEITRLFMDCVFMAGYAYEKELFAQYFEKLESYSTRALHSRAL